ncbi:CSRP2BP (predicted) [Pycnogonum litorale]
MWQGTIAGCLSNGCPQYFENGISVLKQAGWWKLSKTRISDLFTPESVAANSSKCTSRKLRVPRHVSLAQNAKVSSEDLIRPRRKAKNPIKAAMELKERKATTEEAKEIRKRKNMSSSTTMCHNFDENIENIASSGGLTSLLDDAASETKTSSRDRSQTESLEIYGSGVEPALHESKIKEEPKSDDDSSILDCSISRNEMNKTDGEAEKTTSNVIVKKEEDDVADEELEIDVGCVDVDAVVNKSQTFMQDLTEIVEHLPTNPDDVSSDTNSIKPKTSVSDEDENGDDNEEMSFYPSKSTVKRRRRRKPSASVQPDVQKNENISAMSLYEEHQLLTHLNRLHEVVNNCPRARRLRRKLLLRQLKRERSMPLFDLDHHILNIQGKVITCDEHQVNDRSMQNLEDFRVLDRFQSTPVVNYNHRTNSTVHFITRLIGMDDSQISPIISPYTGRVLKPFIRRDYESYPLKLKLLDEIVNHYDKKNDCSSVGRKVKYPIDYSYVRPEYIPSVNNLCRQFFWPGIDLSECLQYPDFSCIALYRKIVIGFAFMVPDVKYNEAYITFILTHPEWRNAGIGTFMLYHLIQTCMGKDITLHVSATNSAVLLYQKFGFKVEEFILDFYEKYLPSNSRECRHAMFLRLNR